MVAWTPGVPVRDGVGVAAGVAVPVVAAAEPGAIVIWFAAIRRPLTTTRPARFS